MSKTLKTLLIVAGILGLVALTACTREITTVQEVNPGASNCFNCHTDNPATDQYHLLNRVAEWENSGHGIGNYVGYAGGRTPCMDCHSGSGFVARLEGTANTEYPTTIGCWNCHAPHSNGNFMLRVTEPQTLVTGVTKDIGVSNICAACHHGRTAATAAMAPDSTGMATITSTHWGAHHGPQADLLFGTNGYEMAGYTYRHDAPALHLTQAGCFGCHGAKNDVPTLGGHSFVMDNGTDLNVTGCNNCHANVTEFDINGVQTETEELLAELLPLLQNLGLLDATGGLVADAQGTPDQVGAAWNYILIEEDRSEGVHNPDYIHDLLQNSIDALNPPVN